jgi:hypothetical protein
VPVHPGGPIFPLQEGTLDGLKQHNLVYRIVGLEPVPEDDVNESLEDNSTALRWQTVSFETVSEEDVNEALADNSKGFRHHLEYAACEKLKRDGHLEIADKVL